MALTINQVKVAAATVLAEAGKFGGNREFMQYAGQVEDGQIVEITTVGDDKWAIVNALMPDGTIVGLFPSENILKSFQASGTTSVSIKFDLKGKASISLTA